MGEKSAEKLISALAASKKKPWYKQLYGLGIYHIGEANAKILAQAFPSISKLADAACNTPELIKDIYGIGDEIIESLREWFSNPSNQELITELKLVGFLLAASPEELKVKSEKLNTKYSSLSGKTFVLTGTLPSLSRNEAKSLIEENGGKVNSTVSTNTTYLVAGDKAGSKLKKAEQIGITILNEKELKKILL